MIETRMEIIELLSKSFIKREITDPQAILAEFDKILIRFENKVKNNIAKSNVIESFFCGHTENCIHKNNDNTCKYEHIPCKHKITK